MLLTELPLELLQTILLDTDAGTLLTSLFSCRAIFNAAKCRTLLLSQLYGIPGLILGIEDLSTTELFLLFRRRATAELYAAGTLSNITNYASTHPLKIRECRFFNGYPLLLATVHHQSLFINIFEIGPQPIRLRTQLHPEFSCSNKIELLKVAFAASAIPISGFDLAALYKTKICLRSLEDSDMSKPRVKDVLKLIVFHHLHVNCSTIRKVKNIRRVSGSEADGLAVSKNGKLAIAWRSPDGASQVLLYGWNANSDDAEDDVQILTTYKLLPRLSIDYGCYLVFDMEFIQEDKCLNFYSPDHPVHKWYTYSFKASSKTKNLDPNRTVLLTPDDEDWGFYSIGMPFNACHEPCISTGDLQTECRTIYLAVAVSIDPGPRSHAFVVQGNQEHVSIGGRNSGCIHSISTADGIRCMGWQPLSRLVGWRQGRSSLGTVMATSPQGRRIASATWSDVLIWSLDLDLLRFGHLSCYFRQNDYHALQDVGKLRPIKLPSRGVVHRMAWLNETVLLTLTDRGLTRWDMDHMSWGQETTCPWDAAPNSRGP